MTFTHKKDHNYRPRHAPRQHAPPLRPPHGCECPEGKSNWIRIGSIAVCVNCNGTLNPPADVREWRP